MKPTAVFVNTARGPIVALENVVLAPHLGSATVETRTAMGMLAARNLLDAIAGRRPAAVVNPEVVPQPRERRGSEP
jgi:glyoxylate reductase